MRHSASTFRRNALSMAILSAMAGMVQALPQNGQVSAGAGSLSSSGSSLTVHQGTQKLIIDWQSFGIGAGESVQFVQPNASAVALNRVLGSNASEIFGQLSANGQVFLTNPNGILFGSGAQVDVGGLVASTLHVGNEDFLSGNYVFTGADGGLIANQGTLKAALGGVIALLAPSVRNEGLIVATEGAIGIGAGTRISLDLSSGLRLDVEQSALNAVIENRQAVRAEGGLIVLSASAQQALLGGMINNTGVIEAGSISEQGGVIRLTAGFQSLGGRLGADGASGGDIAVAANNIDQYGALSAQGTAGAGGTIAVQGERLIQTSAGVIDASGSSTGGDLRLALGSAGGGAFLSGTLDASGGSGRGGDITLTGADLSLVAARLNASGESGGQIRVGGDYQGANPDIANAQSVYVSGSSVLNANAGVQGDGGRVIVWSDGSTEFNGTINARGGSTSGDGGFAEVSGKETLGFAGDANLQAVQGTRGTLLLDPKNLTISSTGGGLAGFRLVDPTSLAGNNFGATMVQLGNGNIVVTSTSDDFAASNGGAVYLFNLSTGALISTLRGAGANSTIGSNGITNLGNGNFLIRSQAWNDGVGTSLGAVTFGNGATGVSGVVDASNSLVGSTTGDAIGSYGINTFTGGNYIVHSAVWDNGAATDAGAATWGSGTTGVSGVVSATNSLVGSSSGDNVGASLYGVGNEIYLLRAASWDNGGIADAGAVTAFNSATGITGVVSASNSLVGSTAFDQVGNSGITVLANGNYLVSSYNWDNAGIVDAGAVTFVNGATGLTGAVSASNSLVGSTGGDYVGYDGDSGITLLGNGNYVVSSLYWDNGAATDAGAFTWGSGSTGVTGVVGASNSLVGSTLNDQVGVGGLTNLGNGNYLLYSYNWDNGTATNAGAVTFINGATGLTGVLGAANSLVGSTADDRVGSTGIHVLANGNYLVRSSAWDNGAIADAGAVTWGSASTGVTGVVDASNSLVGSSASDYVGNSGLTSLGNGNYLIRSQSWDNGAATEAGAVTWFNGATGITGVVSAANSLVGGSLNDSIGNTGTTVLANGNYLVSSHYWDNGAAADAGAITFGNGSTGVTGVVGAANSLVGSATADYIGNNGITQLSNGNYLVASNNWNGYAGAVTWGSGTTGVSGVVSAANSLVGGTANDNVGDTVQALANGNYLVNSWNWDNGAISDAGAVTFGDGTTGVSGGVSDSNSLVGSSTNDYVGYNGSGSGVIMLTNGNYLVNSQYWDNGGAADAGAITWGSGTSGVSGVLGAANSLVGGSTSDHIGNFGITQLGNGNYLVRSANWDNTATAAADAGAVTWGSGTAGVSGLVDASNSLVGSSANDFVGNNTISVLSNNNYVVRSTGWDSGAAADAGAVTWGDGTTGISGVISAANSLVGSSSSDAVGSGGITVVGGSNYVVRSSSWDNGAAAVNAGAVTWGSGTSGVTGVVSAANSLVGSTASDGVGANALVVLANGNYIVRSNVWDNGTLVNAGAVTWGSGTSGISGVISASNSLVGGRANDTIGSQGISLLTNGHYLVRSGTWDSGTGAQAGAVTWANGLGGTVGVVDASNSLVGTRANDQVGVNVPILLANGNYIVRTQLWDNTAAAADAGAVTWGSGLGGTVGAISAANSLVGSKASDQVGNLAPTLLSDGNYIVRSAAWDNGAAVNAGAISFINSTTGASGAVSAANSIVGTVASEITGTTSVTVLPDGNYLVRSPLTTTAGRVTVVVPGGNLSYAQGTGQSVMLHPDALLNILSRGTNLTLQASNDLTVDSALAVNNGNGDGGDLTLQAGRSLAVNAAISTDNGALTLIANDLAANGVIAADRDAGDASLSVAAAITAGTGDVSLQLRNGQANAGGTMSVTGAITANTIAIRQDSGSGFTLNAPLTSTASSGTGIGIVVPTFTSLASGALSSAAGSRWLVWSGDPADDSRGSIAYDFKQYNAVYGSSTVLGTGNGFLYSEAPVIDLDLLAGTDKVYDGSATYTGALSFTASNAIDGDTVTFEVTAAEFTDKNVGSAKTVNISGASFDSAVEGGATVYGYQFTGTGAGIAAITPKAITAAGITAASKVYDATTAVTLDVSAASTSGIIGGDTVTVGASSISGGFDDKNVGTAKTVTVTGFALSGADAGNYTIAGGFTTTADITAKAIDATGITAADKVYDALGTATLDTGSAGFTGMIAGDTLGLDVSAASGSFADKHVGSGKTVTIGSLTLTGADAGNYTLNTATTTASITPKSVTASGLAASDKVYDGNTTAALDISAVSFSGAIAGDDLSIDTASVSAAFDDKNAGTGKTVNVSGISLGGADAGNYALSGGSLATTADITAKAIDATGISASDKIYDALTGATLNTGSAALSGVVAGDTLNLDAGSASGSFADKHAGTAKTVSVAGLSLNGADLGNYTLNGYSTTADITAKSVSASGISAAGKVYDALTAATLDTSAANLSGAIAGDTLSLDASGAVGSFADKNAGTGKTVSVGNLALGGADAGNYSLDSYTTTADITAKSVSATGIAADNKVYDALTGATLSTGSAGLSGTLAGDTLSLDTSAASAAFADKNVGTGKTVSVGNLALGGADAGNYTLDSYSTTADITAKSVSATGITASTKVYDALTGATLDTGSAALTGVIAGDTLTLDASGTSGAFADRHAGSGKTVTVTGLSLGGADLGNYSLDGYTTTADITAKSISATGISAGNKVYDALTAATLDTGSAALSGVIAGDTLTLGTGSASGAFSDKNVGSGKTVTVSGLGLSGTDAGNYTLNGYTTTADIGAKAISATGITAGDKVYDALTTATLNTGSAGLSGAIDGDTVSLASSSASGSFADKNAGTGKTVSVAGLGLDGTDAGNYTLGSYSTTAGITAKAVSATGISAGDKVYDALTGAVLSTGSAGLTGVIAGDTLTLDASGTSGAFADKHAGTGKTVTVSGLGLGGADAGNYTLNGYTTTATVTARTLSVSGITAADKVYDGLTAATLNTGSAGVTGVIGGDTVSFDTGSANGNFSDRNAGTGKTVAVGGLSLSGADAGNYLLDTYATSASITAKAIGATGISADNKVYDALTAATLDTGSAGLAGVIAGDTLTLDVNASSGSFADKNVGSGKTVTVAGLGLGGADAGNYSLNGYTTTASITPKAVSATGITASDKVYDAQLAAALSTGSGALTGGIGGDTLTLEVAGASGSFADKNVGTGKTVTVSGLALGGSDAGNYSLETYTTTAGISQLAIDATGITAADKVFDGTAAATLNLGGAALAGVLGGDSVGLDTGSASGSFADRNAATGKTVTVTPLALTGTDAGNYSLNGYTTTADITPRMLTVTVNDERILSGQALPIFSYGITGFITGETDALVSGLVVGTSTGAHPAAGSYAITAASASAPNYQFSYVDGTLTVDSRQREQAALAAQQEWRLQTNPTVLAQTAASAALFTVEGCGIRLARGSDKGCQ